MSKETTNSNLFTKKNAVIAAAGAGMLATFLPWANVPFAGSISGADTHGWFTFFLFLFVLILGLRINNKKTDKQLDLGINFLAILAGVVGIMNIIDFNSSTKEIKEAYSLFSDLASSYSVGFGLYLVVIAAAAVVISVYYFNGAFDKFLKQNKKTKEEE